MKTVKINGKKIDVSASNERALRLLAAQDYCAATSDFSHKRGKWMSHNLPDDAQRKLFGITEIGRTMSKRSAKFLKDRPRVQYGFEASPRRVNAILKQL